jgi:hypothetical protein
MKALIPWLTVLAVVLLLSALRLRALAGAVALAWLVYAVFTWIRAARSRRPEHHRHDF